MKILFISDAQPPKLPEHQLQCFSLAKTPSLVRVVQAHISDGKPDVILLDQTDGITYSIPHILSAARTAYSHGIRFIAMGQLDEKKPYLTVSGIDELASVLGQTAPAVQPSAAGTPVRATVQCTEKPKPTQTVKPIKLTENSIPLFTVAGSQSRVGCTTQSIQLYHYCKALGFHPALISTPENIQDLAGVMDSQKKDGAIYVEGIPYVTDRQEPFNCFVADLGVLCEANRKTFQDADFQVLVAETKPWELSGTMTSAHLLSGTRRVLILSFCSRNSFLQMKPNLKERVGENTVILPAAIQPDPFQVGMLAHFDDALRQWIEQFVGHREQIE